MVRMVPTRELFSVLLYRSLANPNVIIRRPWVQHPLAPACQRHGSTDVPHAVDTKMIKIKTKTKNSGALRFWEPSAAKTETHQEVSIKCTHKVFFGDAKSELKNSTLPRLF